MKEFIITFKFLLKQNLSLSYFLNKVKEDKRQRNMFLLIFIVLLMSLPSFGFFITKFIDIFDVLQTLKQESFFLAIAVLFSLVIILLFGMYQIIAYFYYSNEVKVLMTFPIKTKYILISKFFVIYVFEILINIFLIAPFFIIYGFKTGLDIMGWLYLFISFLCLPIIPLVLIGTITILLIKATNVFKHKDKIRMIGMFLVLIVVIGLQVGINRILFAVPEGGAQQQQYFENLINDNSYFVNKISSFYPVVLLVVNAIEASIIKATLSLLMLIGISILFVYLFGIILQKLFLKTYLREQESVNLIKKKINYDKSKLNSVANAIAKIDFLTLLRVPIYAMNCLSIVILVPLLLIIMPFFYGLDNLDQLIKLYDSNVFNFWLFAILGMTIFATMNQIASTSFSREGKTNWIMRTLPISAKDHIRGRLNTAIYTQITFIIITSILILIILKQDYLYGLFAIIISSITSMPLLLLGLYIDLKRPMLQWDNPQQAVKQNMNVLIIMGIGMIYGGLMVGSYILLNIVLEPPIVLSIIFVINLLIMYFIYKKLLKEFENSLILMG